MKDSDAICSPDIVATDGGEYHAVAVDFAETPPSVAVVSAIADLENASPNDLDFVLHDHVDGGALDRLVADERDGPLEVTCRVDGYRVRIGRDGSVAVAPSA